MNIYEYIIYFHIHEYLIRTGNDLKNRQKLRIFVTFFTTNQTHPFISKIFIAIVSKLFLNKTTQLF